MSHMKRSRANFEADLQAQQSPFVFFGTPLPALDPQVRDDGSFVPVWNQTVTDERGRKRLHGAFTGGFSAGYFNTVGSKDGWTPSTFLSSRSKRNNAVAQKAEDFMDEEDLAEQEESRKIETNDGFSGLGSTKQELSKQGGLMDLFKSTEDTMGMKLLRKMGWRDGQGIGPKVRRKANLDASMEPTDNGDNAHLFAPQNSPMIAFVRKTDQKGLGFDGETPLAQSSIQQLKTANTSSGEDEPFNYPASKTKKKQQAPKSAFGVGVLNDNGSDDDDPYEMGPRLSYNKVIGGDKKTKKAKIKAGSSTSNSNPLLRSKPIFISKKTSKLKVDGFRRCHDGRLPLDGFILSTKAAITKEAAYTPPKIPEGWISSKTSTQISNESDTYASSADLAKASTLDPSSRAAILGETQLPGKSIFDFLTPNARNRLVTLTNKDLPPAGSETVPSVEQDISSLLPQLDPQVAAAALGRGVSGFVPYSDNPTKLSRYREFLSYRANLTSDAPKPPLTMRHDHWLRELQEFAQAATIFKPMAGVMASRFTSSSSTTINDKVTSDNVEDYLYRPSAKPTDPAVEAAKMGMWGPLTRSSVQFFPSRLLCKRFNVPVPSHVVGDNPGPGRPDISRTAVGHSTAADTIVGSRFHNGGFQAGSSKNLELVGTRAMDELKKLAGVDVGQSGEETTAVAIDPDRNEALEAERPGEAVFAAIFGDSDSDDE